MITPMKKINICGVKNSRKACLETLQKYGVVEITRQEENCGAGHLDVSERITQFDRYISASSKAIDILDDIAPEKKGLFSVRKDISCDKYSMNADEISSVGSVALEIISSKKKIEDNILSIGKRRAQIESITPWLGLDVPMNTSGTERTEACLMSVPMELDPIVMDEILGDIKDRVYYEIEYASKNISNVFLVYPRDYSDKVAPKLRENGFSLSQAGLSHRTPEKKIENIKEKIKALENHNKELTEKIASYASKRDEIKLFYDHLVLRKEKYLNLQNLLVTDEASFTCAHLFSGIYPSIKNASSVTSRFCRFKYFSFLSTRWS